MFKCVVFVNIKSSTEFKNKLLSLAMWTHTFVYTVIIGISEGEASILQNGVCGVWDHWFIL